MYAVTARLTGYTAADLERFLESDLSYGDFFKNTPRLNENCSLIRGSVKVEIIQAPPLQKIRYLDKLVDELAKGKAMDKILRKGPV